VIKRKWNRDARWQEIKQQLESQPVIQISELASYFEVSVETVRKDIDEMAMRGMVVRTHGGAANAKTASEPTLLQRAEVLIEERKKISLAALPKVNNGDVLMIDASATCVHFGRLLAKERESLTVITNSFSVAEAVACNQTFTTLILPGIYNAHENASYGGSVLEFIQRYQADHCFSSCGALTSGGPTEVDTEVACLKRAMIQRSKLSTLLIDHSKLCSGKLETVCPLSQLDEVICDITPTEEIQSALEKASVKLYVL
jgi:DeoR/GlpR family transcriptional regulator of sugar metabolism